MYREIIQARTYILWTELWGEIGNMVVQ